jgi:hypothetical protein
MAKIDVEIYVKKLIDFFENNPNDLMNLIGDNNKKLFYDEIKKVAFENFEKKEPYELTQNQLIDIVRNISGRQVIEADAIGSFILTKYGLISMN